VSTPTEEALLTTIELLSRKLQAQENQALDFEVVVGDAEWLGSAIGAGREN
jgi:hypothetical protein